MKKMTDRKKDDEKAAKSSLQEAMPTIAIVCVVLCTVVFCFELTSYLRLQKELKALVTQSPQIEWYDELKSTQNSNEIIEPTEESFAATGNAKGVATQTTASPIRQTVVSSESKTGNTYVLNTKSKKIHKPTCRYAQSMSEENKQTVSQKSTDELLNEGYSYCKVCFKEKN